MSAISSAAPSSHATPRELMLYFIDEFSPINDDTLPALLMLFSILLIMLDSCFDALSE